MKIKLLFVAMVIMATFGAHAALIYSSGTLNAAIPDGNINGYQNTISVSGLSENQSVITDVDVKLNVSGGYNGDLYISITHSSGFSVLLNRTGRTGSDPFGYGDAGFNVTLDDSASTDIHAYGGNGGAQLLGIWQPDARSFDPATVTYDSPRNAFLGAFNGLDPNGSWTLFAADMSTGDQSTLVSWELNITTVPEPVPVALGIFGGLAGAGMLFRRLRSRYKTRSSLVTRAATNTLPPTC